MEIQVERNQQFADFLRARREQTAPESVGLPPLGRPRRVSGLRREEVAQLASMSCQYYTRLEQGRLPPPSDAVLDAIIKALRLDADQARYLRTLARRAGTRHDAPPAREQVAPELRTLIENLTALPAMVVTRHLDILAWNRLAATFFVDFSKFAPEGRNLILLGYLNDEMRRRFKDWPSAAQTGAALLRMRTAHNPTDARLLALVDEIARHDEDFRRWWGAQRVVSHSHGQRKYIHPRVGELELVWHTLSSTEHPNQSLAYLTPPPNSNADQTLRCLASLAALPEAGLDPMPGS